MQPDQIQDVIFQLYKPLLLLYAAVILIPIAFRFYKIRKLNLIFRSLTDKRNGFCKSTLFFSRPKISFSYNDKEIKGYMLKRSRYHPLTFVLETKVFTAKEVKLRVVMNSSMNRMKIMLGKGKIEVNDPEFNQRFLIQCNPESELPLVLTDEVQRLIFSSSHLKPDVSFNLGNLVVSFSKSLRNEYDFEECINFYTHLTSEMLKSH